MATGHPLIVPPPPPPPPPATVAPAPAVTPAPVPPPKKGKSWAALISALALCGTALIMSQNDKEVSMAQIASAGKGQIPAIPARSRDSRPYEDQPRQQAYVPPPVRDTPRPAPKALDSNESWGPVNNLGKGNVVVPLVTNAKGRALLCGDVEMPACLMEGYTAPGAVLDFDQCGPNRRVLQIIPGECAKISKL